MGKPGKDRMRSMLKEWPCGARMVSCSASRVSGGQVGEIGGAYLGFGPCGSCAAARRSTGRAPEGNPCLKLRCLRGWMKTELHKTYFSVYDSYIGTIEANLGALDGRGVQRKILDWELPSVHRHRAVDRG